MYDVKAEKNPVSAVLLALSTICEGVCKGMPGIGREDKTVDEKGGTKELTKRLDHIRMTYYLSIDLA